MIEVSERRPNAIKVCLLLLITGTAWSACAEETLSTEAAKVYRCGKGDDIRRIEIRFENEQDELPCRVVYRPEAESDTIGTVSWRGLAELTACQQQAQQVVDRLTAEGWSCAFNDKLAIAGIPVDAANRANGEDAETKETDLAIPSQGTLDERESVEPATLVDNPALTPPSPELAALIRGDLQQLDTTLDGKLEAQIADYGDLNADDIADALVLYTYASPQPAYRQFLAAYLFDGEAYQLTATKPVGGSAKATRDAKVEGIDQGVVHLSLRAFEPGDASCCPTGTRHLTLALRDLDLVEIDTTAPIR